MKNFANGVRKWFGKPSTVAPYESTPARKAKDKTVGFGPVTVPPNNQFVVVQAFPQCLFRGEHILVEESVPGSTSIIALFVGQKFQLIQVDGNGIRSSTFKDSRWQDYLFDTCQVALAITFWVRNNTDTPVIWSASITGKAVE